MALKKRAGIPPKSQRCAVCGRRWKQDGAETCRTCGGFDNKLVQVARAERRRLEDEHRVRPERVQFSGERTVTIRGVEYVVAWDGALDGAHALGRPRAEERPTPYMSGRDHMGDHCRLRETRSAKWADGHHPDEGGL
jgi:hypothetical protein